MRADLQSLAVVRGMARTIPQRICIDLLADPTSDTLLGLVHEAIDFISSQMSQNPELKQGLSEDQLTIEIVQKLQNMGFSADHETKIGGHCDITIKGPEDFVWLGEAKKFDSDYGWIMSGFNQLCSRYSTGLPNQSSGGIIIYVFAERTDRILNRWSERMLSSVEDVVIDVTTVTQGYITSNHPHRRTGASYTIRHKAISLLWKPD